MKTENVGNSSLMSLFQEMIIRWKQHFCVNNKKENNPVGGGFYSPQNLIWPDFHRPSSTQTTLLNPALKVNTLQDDTTLISCPALCKLLHLSACDWLTHSAVAAPWPHLKVTCPDSPNCPWWHIFGTEPTLSQLALAWMMETLCPFHSWRRTPPPFGDHSAN